MAAWKPVADFVVDPKTLTDGELESLSRVWADQKAELSDTGSLEEFDKRLRREWSIKTRQVLPGSDRVKRFFMGGAGWLRWLFTCGRLEMGLPKRSPIVMKTNTFTRSENEGWGSARR